jgi:hypothetical protein
MLIIQILKYLITKLDSIIKNIFTSKKLPLFAILMLLYSRKQTLPDQVNSSEFLRLLTDHSNGINFLSIFLSNFILFDYRGKSYFTNYSPSNTDEFSNQLM